MEKTPNKKENTKKTELKSKNNLNKDEKTNIKNQKSSNLKDKKETKTKEIKTKETKTQPKNQKQTQNKQGTENKKTKVTPKPKQNLAAVETIKPEPQLPKTSINIKSKVSKNFKTAEVLIIMLITMIISFIIGFLLFSIVNPQIIKKSYNPYLNKLIENYEYITDNYYKEINEEKLVNGAISGMLDTINDPYTNYIDEENSDTFNKTLNGYYQGIGVEMYDLEEGVVINRVFESSPAQKAGIQKGDIIEEINGVIFLDKTGSEIAEYVKNNISNQFVIKIKRGEEHLTLNLISETVVIPSVDAKIIESNGKKIGYINLDLFALNTGILFERELKSLEDSKIDSLIIDVRDNTGGHLSSAEEILSLFLDSDKIIYQMNKKNVITKHYSKGKETKKYPIVILGNHNSASASEILIAALRENYQAAFIGTTTFGKGTAQSLKEITSKEEYKITSQTWLTPSGNSVNEIGIKPDEEIELYSYYFTNPSDESDNQLQKAIKYLTK